MTTQTDPDQRIQRTLPFALVAVLLAIVLVIAGARWAGFEPRTVVDAATVATAQLAFRDEPDGSIRVLNASNGVTIKMVAPGGGGFLRSTLRGLVRERKRQGVAIDAGFSLVARSDGRLTLLDDLTRRRVDLESFGETNKQVFVDLLQLAEHAAPTALAAKGTRQ
jgi:putative photosynthetic complex assembly protein